MAIVRITGALEAKVVAGATVQEVAQNMGLESINDKDFKIRGQSVALNTAVADETVITVGKKVVGA